MIDKKLVRQRFGKNLSEYNKNATIQKQMAERLFSFLDTSEKYKNILEIGCGTGILTEITTSNINYECFDCIDIVSECENFIKKIDSNINFINDDIEEYIEHQDKKYDLIISNASLQWIENFEEFAVKLLNILNPKGVLLFSTFGKENYREIFFILGKTLHYRTIRNFKEIFKGYKIQIEEEIRIMSFKTPKDVLKHLKSTGVNGIEPIRWTKKDLIAFENGYNNICSNNPTLTYNPIYVTVKNK